MRALRVSLASAHSAGAALTSVCLALCSAAARAAPEPGVPASRGAAGTVLQGAPPAAGHYDAVLCVTVGAAGADCGAVAAEVSAAGQTLVRISDIVYRLERYGEQLGVSLFHGTMQIDGFFAPYQWTAQRLQFIDSDKATRYELKLGPRRFDAR